MASAAQSPHVLVVPSWYPATPGDVLGSFFREQAQVLHEGGYQVGVIAVRSLSLRKPRAWGEAARLMSVSNDDGVPTFRHTSVEWFGRIPFLGIGPWVNRGLRLFDAYVGRYGTPDVLHAHGLLNGGCLAQEISKRTGIPYVVTEHSSSYARGLVGSWKLRRAADAARSASARIAVSEALVGALASALSMAPDRWTVIPNIVDKRFLKGSLRIRRGAESGCRFAAVGSLTENKNQEAIIRAFATAFRGDPDMTLVIAGDGPERARLERTARAVGAADRISFQGRISREGIRELLLATDVFVLASTVETFGVAAVEALAMGVPVLSTRSGGPESIVTPENGVLVPPGDDVALSQAMRDMAMNNRRYDPSDLRDWTLANFGGTTVAGRLGDLYSQLQCSSGSHS